MRKPFQLKCSLSQTKSHVIGFHSYLTESSTDYLLGFKFPVAGNVTTKKVSCQRFQTKQFLSLVSWKGELGCFSYRTTVMKPIFIFTHLTITVSNQYFSIFRMLMIPVTEPVGGTGVPHVTYDWLSVSVTQNPLHAPILVVVAHNVSSGMEHNLRLSSHPNLTRMDCDQNSYVLLTCCFH